MNTDQTITAFTEFYRDRGHQPIGSSSLLSRPGDPVLFTSAGMHPLTPYLAGQPHPLGGRLTGSSAACGPPTWTKWVTTRT